VPAQRSLYRDDEWALRCSVRPGITGLAQAVLRSEGSEDERRALDLRYVREHDVWLDLKIMAWTLRRLTGKGSN
jgi:lipopolysaccharide/colanic/teichoic acid biosynthesis glycosyltransferase